MRPSIVWTIFRKELIETLRDRRTLLMMVGLPVLLYPMMIIGISWFQQSQSEKREERASAVAVWGEDAPPVVDWLGAAGKLIVKRWAGASTDIRRTLADPASRPRAGRARIGCRARKPAGGGHHGGREPGAGGRAPSGRRSQGRRRPHHVARLHRLGFE